jgi:hypothetical protein
MWIVLVKQEMHPENKYGNLSEKEDCGDGRTILRLFYER